MKRKLDKNKIYAFIGRAVVYATFYAVMAISLIWAFNQNTVY